MLLVGSRALVAHGIKIGRKPSDWDLIATMDELHEWYSQNESGIVRHEHLNGDKKRAYFFRDRRIVEIEIVEHNDPTTRWLHENYGGLGYDREETPWGEAVHPDVVLALKLSHRYLKNSPHFRKTMDDILALRGLKYRVPQSLTQFVKDRQKETLNYGHPSLERDKKKFFSGDGVKYKYEHDDIHKALATIWHEPSYSHKPAYFFFQRDGAEVATDKEKFFILPEQYKLLSVLEESYVLALERSQIPTGFSIAPRTSFLIALEKVCTSITSGWWREYAWDHYYQVLGMYNDDYVDRFHDSLSRGKIRDYQGTGV